MHSYQRGDCVWCLNEQRRVGVCSKLQPSYLGPYVVKKKINDQDFVVQKNEDETSTFTVHFNKLKAYLGINIPEWAEQLRAGN